MNYEEAKAAATLLLQNLVRYPSVGSQRKHAVEQGLIEQDIDYVARVLIGDQPALQSIGLPWTGATVKYE